MNATVSQLDILVRDNKKVLEPMRHRLERNCEPFPSLRDCAKQLHKLMKVVWSCACKPAHKANIQLKIRDSDCIPSFHVLFSFAEKPSLLDTTQLSWHDTEFIQVDRGGTWPPSGCTGQEDPNNSIAKLASNLTKSSMIARSIVASSLQTISPSKLPPPKSSLSNGKHKRSILNGKTSQFEDSSKLNKMNLQENMIKHQMKTLKERSNLHVSPIISEPNLTDITDICAFLSSCRRMKHVTQHVGSLTGDCRQFEVRAHEEEHVAGIGSEKAFYVMATYFRGNRISKGSDPCTSQEC